MSDEKTTKQPVFHKQITLGNLLSMASILGSVGYGLFELAGYAHSMDTRVAVVEQTQRDTNRLIDNQQRQIERMMDAILPGDHAENK